MWTVGHTLACLCLPCVSLRSLLACQSPLFIFDFGEKRLLCNDTCILCKPSHNEYRFLIMTCCDYSSSLLLIPPHTKSTVLEGTLWKVVALACSSCGDLKCCQSSPRNILPSGCLSPLATHGIGFMLGSSMHWALQWITLTAKTNRTAHPYD